MEGKMLAVVKTSAKQGGTEIKEVPIPEIGPDDVLVKINIASICGTDTHIYTWDDWAANRIKAPLIYGHEFAGTVVELGKNVSNLAVGDLVSGECHIVCGYCHQCRTGNAHICQNVNIFGVDSNGIFAEYAKIPAANILKNNPTIPQEICSIQDPLGNALHCLQVTNVAGKRVAIIGAGPIGMMAISLCKIMGASKIFVIEGNNTFRKKIAERLGATKTYLAHENITEDIFRLTGGDGVDIAFEMSGNVNAFQQGLDILRLGGEYIILGVYAKSANINISKDIVFKYITIKGVNGRKMFETWYTMKGLLHNPILRKDLETIITHRYPFTEFETAMKTMLSGLSGKVVLHLDE